MNIDHFFTIGSAHQSQGRPCEDYALSGSMGDTAVFGVVADGCSGAAAHTDVGARALAWAFQATLEQTPLNPEKMLSNSFQDQLLQRFVKFQYSVVKNDALATLVGFVATQDTVQVLAHGDGAVAIRYADGRMALIEFEWLNSMPFYLAYYTSPSALEEFLAPYLDEQVSPFKERTTLFKSSADGLVVESVTERKCHAKEMLGGHKLQLPTQGIECLAVMTDGYAQVGTKAPIEVAHEVLNFKNVQGEFVKRRMLRALKDFHKDQAIPRDDLGVAAVWFDHEITS